MRENRYKKYGLNKLFTKNWLMYFMILTFFLLLPIFLIYENMSYKWSEENEMRSKEMLNRYTSLFEDAVSQVETYVIDLSVKQDVKAVVSSENGKYFQNNVQGYMRFYKNINDCIDNIFIYSKKNNMAITLNKVIYFDYNNKPVSPELGEKISRSLYYSTFARNNKYPYVIRIAQYIDEDSYAAIDIDLHKLNKTINSRLEDNDYNSAFFLDDEGKVICSNKLSQYFNSDFSDIVKIRDEEYLEFNDRLYSYNEKKSEKYPVRTVVITDAENFLIMKRNIYVYMIIMCIFAFVMSVLISYFISVRTVNPILNIVDAIKKKEVDEKFLAKAPKEVIYIVNDLLKSIKNKNEVMQDTSMRLLLFKIASMEALQAQINPHFMYNTLDSINWMAYEEMGKNNKVSQSISNLSDLYRIIFKKDEYIISFATELNHIKLYMDMVNIRFDNPVELLINVDDDIKDAEVLKFMLQPIVENSIYHGIVPSDKSGKIEINAYKEDKYLFIEIKDNGIGMDDERISEINEELKKGLDELEESIVKSMYGVQIVDDNLEKIKRSWWLNRKKSDIGVGIKNTNNRIKLIFGNEYEIVVSKNIPDGVKTLIKLPFNKKTT